MRGHARELQYSLKLVSLVSHSLRSLLQSARFAAEMIDLGLIIDYPLSQLVHVRILSKFGKLFIAA
jgi:hypothetical protein